MKLLSLKENVITFFIDVIDISAFIIYQQCKAECKVFDYLISGV